MDVVEKTHIQLRKRQLRGSIQRYLEWAEKEAHETRQRLLNGATVDDVSEQLRNIRNYGSTLSSLLERHEALQDLG